MKILIYSHSKDIDGLGSIILGKLAFNSFDYELFPSPKELCDRVLEDLKSNKYSSFDKVFITDLTLPEPAISLFDANEFIKNKIAIFDHHHSAIINGYNLYDFSHIKVVDDNGMLTCGTRLFYEHLVNNGYLTPTNVLNDLVEKIRLEDTWDWKKAGSIGVEAHNLAILHSKLGNELFISEMLNSINKSGDKLQLSTKNIQIIEATKQENEKIINALLDQMEYFTDESNNKYGIVLGTHDYVNDLAQKIRDLQNPNDIDYIIVVSLESNSRSYRSIDYQNFNVATIAINHGGGGQFGAAGAGITEEQKAKALTLNKKDALKYLANSKYERTN